MESINDSLRNLIRDGNWCQCEEILKKFSSSSSDRLKMNFILQNYKWQILKTAPISTIRMMIEWEYYDKHKTRKKCVSDFNLLLNVMNAAHANRESILLRVVKLWIDNHPSISMERDQCGFTLLHHACLKKSHNVDLIEYLIHVNPDSVKIQDKVGRTPIYTLCCVCDGRACDDKFMNLLQRFVELYPDALVSKCVTGKSPLLAYLERDEAILDHRIVRILSTNDEILWCKTPSGLLPIEYYWLASEQSKITDPLVIQALLQDSRRKECGLVHTVIGMNGNQSRLLDYVLQWFKSDAMIYCDGQLPLHYILTNPWLSFYWRQLLEAFPGAVKKIDRTTNLYPFLIASLTCTYLDISYELLRVEPNLISFLSN